MDARMETLIARRREMVGRVKQVLIERLNLDLQPDEVDEDSALFGFGLGLDSIDALTLIVGLEDQFGIPFPDKNVHIFRSINTIVDFIVGSARENAQPKPAA